MSMSMSIDRSIGGDGDGDGDGARGDPAQRGTRTTVSYALRPRTRDEANHLKGT